jgi:hypothetical protein
MLGRLFENLVGLLQVLRAKHLLVETVIPDEALAGIPFTLEGRIDVGVRCTILINLQLLLESAGKRIKDVPRKNSHHSGERVLMIKLDKHLQIISIDLSAHGTGARCSLHALSGARRRIIGTQELALGTLLRFTGYSRRHHLARRRSVLRL